MRFAVTHPGKLGDALYTLPIIRYLYGVSSNPVDFYTSEYCRPMKELFEYQSCIGKFIISEGYIAERMDMGIQPIDVPVPLGEYNTTFHLGFRNVPDKRLDWFMAESIGINPHDLPMISYEHTNFNDSNMLALNDGGWIFMDNPYVVIAARGETGYKETFRETANLLLNDGYGVVYIGGKGDNTDLPGFDATGLNFLDTTTVISNSKGFLGLMSSQLVLANGFDIPKVAPHNGINWDMRHVVYSESNFYPVDPSAKQILDIIKDYYR